MGTVYEAYQASMRRKVALKVLDAGLLPSTNQVTRFEREAWIGGRLNHPNIVRVYSQGFEGTHHYIAMELVAGESLAAAIAKARQERSDVQPSDSAWRSGHIRTMVERFVGVADALDHVHRQGIVHRDIKPANLLLAQASSRLLLSDFGLARDEQASQLTRRGDFLGTVRYMSPEQLLAQRARVDHRSDIWSLGVALYEALTLDLPYAAATEEGYISAISTKDPAPARSKSRAVPRDLETLLIKCLERDPDNRYPSALEMKLDLQRFLDGRPVNAKRPGHLLKSVRFAARHRLPLAMVLIGVIAGAGVLGLVSWRAWQKRDLERIARVLEEVIEQGRPAPLVDRDWADLQAVLQRELARDPGGELALLAHEATCRESVYLPSFDLIASDPGLMVGHGFPPDSLSIGKTFSCASELSARWDAGPWHVVESSILNVNAGEGYVGFTPLSRFLKPDEISPGMHQLELRSRRLLLDSSPGAEGNGTFVGSGPLELEKLRDRKILASRTSTLGVFPITLFGEQPANFPAALHATDLPGPVQDWFKVERVSVLRTRLPATVGGAFRLPEREDIFCSPPLASTDTLLVQSIELEGRFDYELALPIASLTTLAFDEPGKDALRFPFQFGGGVTGIDFSDWYRLVSRAEGEMGVATDGFPVASRMFLRYEEPRSFLVLPSTVIDGVHQGSLALAPSQQVAWSNRTHLRYLGDEIVFPVRIEVRTVTAIPIEEAGCENGAAVDRNGGWKIWPQRSGAR